MNFNKETLERLAELEHRQWSTWMKYMVKNLNPENIEKWKKQADTPYNNLTEKEKNSDRNWAKEVLKILNGS